MRNSFIYLAFFSTSIFILVLIFQLSISMFPTANGMDTFTNADFSFNGFHKVYIHNLQEPIAILLLQIVCILIVAKGFSWAFIKIGIPGVVGEIFAGLTLGPSLLGYLFPEIFQSLFPKDSMAILKIISHLGLILFMFIIGLETSWDKLKDKLHSAIVISHFSILFPFLLGIGIALYLFREMPVEGVSFLSFSLFMGIAMAITAFPVLAKIIQERNLTQERSGILAISCAAADDVTAWFLLALIISLTQATSLGSILLILVFIGIYLLFSFRLIRPFFRRLIAKFENFDYIPKSLFLMILVWLTISSLFTETLGIHALFGAFVAGMSISGNVLFRSKLLDRIEPLATVYLLPLFFVYSGLKTDINLVLGSNQLMIAQVLVLIIAIMGKLGGSVFISKVLGESWKDSFIIGILMNTRGLMELVVLNIGLELGIISKEIFTIMVVMAIVTTAMTGPLLNLVNLLSKRSEDMKFKSELNKDKVRILIPFARPETGINLTKLAFKIFPNSEILCFHVAQNYGIDIESSNLPQCVQSDKFFKAVFSGNSMEFIQKFYLEKNNKYLDNIFKNLNTDTDKFGILNPKDEHDNHSDLLILKADKPDDFELKYNYLIFF